MCKKLLLFISILIINSTYSLADNSVDLPALPPTEEVVVVSDENDKQSFFEKLKNFFGFGTEHKEQAAEVNKEVHSETAQPPAGMTDEGPIASKQKQPDEEISSRSPSQVESNSAESQELLHQENSGDLELPKGFDDIKEDISATNEAGQPKQDDSTKEPSGEGNISGTKPAETPETIKPKIEQSPAVVPKEDVTLTLPAPAQSDENTDKSLPVEDKPLTPSVVDKPEVSPSLESNISKYKKELDLNRKNSETRQRITAEELTTPSNNSSLQEFNKVTSVELDPVQLAFVNNEAQVLTLPDDDVVLGEVTKEAALDFMDLRSYLKLFWDNYDRIKREPDRIKVEHFIEEYDDPSAAN